MDRLMETHSEPESSKAMTMEMLLNEENKCSEDKGNRADAEEEMGKQEPVTRAERRTSARKKDITLTTEAKTMMMSKKRNLEGTNLNSENSFSILNNVDIMQLSVNMGVNINDNDFAAIDLIKDLEMARHSLANKKLETENHVVEDEIILEEIEEETSDYNEELIKTPKRKSKPRTRLSLSGPKIKKGKAKENPGFNKNGGGGQGNPDHLPPSKKGKSKLK